MHPVLITIAAVALVLSMPPEATSQSVRVLFIAPSGGGSAALEGAQLGIEESKRVAEMLDLTFDVETAAASDSEEALRLLSRLADERPLTAVIGGYDLGTCRTLSRAADELSVLYLNIGCPEDELRGESCAPHTFHVLPSAAMMADAAAQSDGREMKSAAWHGGLFRYGAAQLNERFVNAFDRPMDGEGWAAWMAFKVVAESALRAKSPDPAVIRRYLASASARFDGHKGRPLTFRPWDHQLRQPLYLIAGSGGRRAEVHEVPQHAGPDIPVSAVLDQLGTGKHASTCRLATTESREPSDS